MRAFSLSPDSGHTLRDVDLVIFDFDGVIADSEVLSLGTLRDTLADFGIFQDLDEVRARFLGTSLKTISAYVSEHSPNGQAAQFGQSWQSRLFDKFRDDLTPMPNIMDVLEKLGACGIRHCVASSSSFERIAISMKAMNVTAHFDHIFSAEQVKRGKPFPDLFLHAAQEMSVEPSRCLVIEDSPHGVRAAMAGGMRVYGFVGGSHLQGLKDEHGALLCESGAEQVLHDLQDLI